MTLLLMRHGETALNVARVLQPADTPLGERGLAQARAVANRLVAMGVVAVVSSDLPRALQTALAITAATGAPLETTPLLQERNFGDWRGRPYDTLPVDPLTMAPAPPGGESAVEFEGRIARAFAHLLQRHAALGGPLAVVTHGLVIRALLDRHIAVAVGSPWPAHLGNTGLTIVDADPPHAARLVNCTRHLQPEAGDDANALSGG
jgi:probable phosphoglycerate mutase